MPRGIRTGYVLGRVFITGLDPEFAAENVGYFTAPYEVRAKLGKPVVDREHKRVQVTVPGGVTRTAVYLGDQGCVTLPIGERPVRFTPIKLRSTLPDASTQPLPLPPQIDSAKLEQAVDAADAGGAARLIEATAVRQLGRRRVRATGRSPESS
jgi:hypothetical protein